MKRLGIAVGPSAVHAVLLVNGAIAWAGRTRYGQLSELAEAVGRLAAESGRVVRRARIVLERDLVQLRTVTPAPPLKPGTLRRYVALEAPRLFRKNGVPLATDGQLVPVDAKTKALYAAAVPEPLVSAILDGARQAGLKVDALGPASDVLPWALVPEARRGEIALPTGTRREALSVGPFGTWRSRLLVASQPPEPTEREDAKWDTALEALGGDAPHFAAAFAASIALPRLELWPFAARAGRIRERRRRMLRAVLAGVGAWTLAGGLYVGRLLSTAHSTTSFLRSVATRLDSALAARRDLDAGLATLATIAHAEQTRSHHLILLSDVSAALGDSAYLVAYQVDAAGSVRLAGYAPGAAAVVARMSRIPELQQPRLEGPVTRETPAGGRELDRFAIVAGMRRRP